MITEEQIEDAAADYAENQIAVGDKNFLLECGFSAGAEWAIEKLKPNWTLVMTKSDLPKDNKSYWVQAKDGEIIVKEGFSMSVKNTIQYTPVIIPKP